MHQSAVSQAQRSSLMLPPHGVLQTELARVCMFIKKKKTFIKAEMMSECCGNPQPAGTQFHRASCHPRKSLSVCLKSDFKGAHCAKCTFPVCIIRHVFSKTRCISLARQHHPSLLLLAPGYGARL